MLISKLMGGGGLRNNPFLPNLKNLNPLILLGGEPR